MPVYAELLSVERGGFEPVEEADDPLLVLKRQLLPLEQQRTVAEECGLEGPVGAPTDRIGQVDAVDRGPEPRGDGSDREVELLSVVPGGLLLHHDASSSRAK